MIFQSINIGLLLGINDEIPYPWGVAGQRIKYAAERVPEYRSEGYIWYTSSSGNNQLHENRPQFTISYVSYNYFAFIMG